MSQSSDTPVDKILDVIRRMVIDSQLSQSSSLHGEHDDRGAPASSHDLNEKFSVQHYGKDPNFQDFYEPSSKAPLKTPSLNKDQLEEMRAKRQKKTAESFRRKNKETFLHGHNFTKGRMSEQEHRTADFTHVAEKEFFLTKDMIVSEDRYSADNRQGNGRFKSIPLYDTLKNPLKNQSLDEMIENIDPQSKEPIKKILAYILLKLNKS